MRLPVSASALTVLAALLASRHRRHTGHPRPGHGPSRLDRQPVEAAWWSWDGKQVLYKQKRTGSPLRDVWQTGARPA
jgi:hypothetical protein